MGFIDLIKNENSSKFMFVAVDTEAAIHRKLLLERIVSNNENVPNSIVTLISFAYRKLLAKSNPSVTCLDYVSNEYPGIDLLYRTLNEGFKESQKKILVIDDLAMFWILNEKNIEKIRVFFQQISKSYSKVFLVHVAGTIKKISGSDIISCICNYADRVVHIRDRPIDAPGYICNVLWLKPSGKTVVEASYLAIRNGEFQDVEMEKAKDDTSRDAEDVMGSLTTFKLTVEDNEKQSRELLNLPYFDAQRTSVPTPDDEFFDDYDDDDDD